MRCATCRAEFLVTFRCKGRGFCPSCHARRLAEWSLWLDERLLAPVMKRVVILAPGDHVVTVADLALKPTTAPATLLEELAESERDKIAAMLKHVSGSRTEASRALGIPRTTLSTRSAATG